jgi:hypothetical protein
LRVDSKRLQITAQPFAGVVRFARVPHGKPGTNQARATHAKKNTRGSPTVERGNLLPLLGPSRRKVSLHLPLRYPDKPICIYDRPQLASRGLPKQQRAVAEGGELPVTLATGMAAVSAVQEIWTARGEQIVGHSVL